jgi:hypothetical protein
MCDSCLSPMGWLSFSACPLPKCPIERGKDNRPTLGGTMSVLALSLGLSTVLILTALHIASYMHIHARGHTYNCIHRSSCKEESCHKCHKLQVPKDQPNTQSPNLDVSKFNARIPLEKLYPWPYEHRQHIALHNPPKVQGTIPSLGWAYHHVAYT